jgi:hyperosmotically inducible periplasmic protein
MKIIRKFLILTIAFLTVSLADVNAQSFSDTKSARTLEQKVFKKILYLPYYGVFDNIKFKVDGSTVTLYGKVYNGTNKSSAENAVEDIDGVTSVVNNIELLPPSPFDNSIRRQLLYSFGNTAGMSRYLQEPNPSIRLIVENGRVTLEGFVSNRSDANLMNILANGVSGVFKVNNNLIVNKEQVR